MTRVSLWCGAVALAVGSFIAITHNTVIAQDTANIDRAVMLWMARLRTPVLTGAMVDLTALGSPTLVTVFTVVTFVILIVLHHRRSSPQLAIASLGTWLLTYVTKDIVERRRPVTAQVQEHVQAMYARLREGRPINARDPLFAALFRNADKIDVRIEKTAKGLRASETSNDAEVVNLIRRHAQVVSLFIANGMPEMMKSH